MTAPPTQPQKPTAFSRLHRKLQQSLYGMNWTKLRQIQVDAIHELFDGDGDIIISARTAAGKTEAAFLPILSQIVEDHQGSVRAVYAGPLKALINDQFLRLERLCELAEIPVHKWHGDVGQAERKRLFEKPSGVLLITPESIESLFVNHPHKLAGLFSALRYFVIDEMHSFLGNERGAHLRSLMTRLGGKSRESVRRIGLSATLGDPKAATWWLRPGQPDGVTLLEDNESKGISMRLSGYVRPGKAHRPPKGAEADEESSLEDPLVSDVFRAFHRKSALIFANRKDSIEDYADQVRRLAERKGVPNTFRVHHGSLSKGEREETEEALRAGQAVATFCSSTLEMGIDVGSVKAVGQIGSPWSVNSLAQRLGRSGRKEGENSEIRIYVEQDEPGSDANLLDRLFPELLQAIAMTELLLAKWCEPPDVDRLHLSTLVQQIMSVITESGGANATALFASLVGNGAFPTVSHETFVSVLRSMGKSDLIEQTQEGPLVLGLLGERIVRSRDFYMAFVVPEEYRVIHNGRHIGNVTSTPDLQTDGYIILAGRRWKVLQIDESRKEIVAEPSPAGRTPRFDGAGFSDIHPKVRQMMRSLLVSREDLPIYLDGGAKEMLTTARAAAKEANLERQSFIQDGTATIWFPWTGSRVQRALIGLWKQTAGRDVHKKKGIALVFEKTTKESICATYESALTNWPSAIDVARALGGRSTEKYEPFLSDELQCLAFANHHLDLGGAMKVIQELRSEPSSETRG
jgi:ATP-dependent helicase Lhr and Lhr-like helicase